LGQGPAQRLEALKAAGVKAHGESP
jgi:hypothetical protein